MKVVSGQEGIEDELRKLMRAQGWAFLDCMIGSFESFKQAYSPMAAREVIQFTKSLTIEVIESFGSSNDVLGLVEDSNWLIITTTKSAPELKTHLKVRFKNEVVAFYSQLDRERGYSIVADESGNEEQVPLMTLAVGLTTDDDFNQQ